MGARERGGGGRPPGGAWGSGVGRHSQAHAQRSRKRHSRWPKTETAPRPQQGGGVSLHHEKSGLGTQVRAQENPEQMLSGARKESTSITCLHLRGPRKRQCHGDTKQKGGCDQGPPSSPPPPPPRPLHPFPEPAAGSWGLLEVQFWAPAFLSLDNSHPRPSPCHAAPGPPSATAPSARRPHPGLPVSQAPPELGPHTPCPAGPRHRLLRSECISAPWAPSRLTSPALPLPAPPANRLLLSCAAF